MNQDPSQPPLKYQIDGNEDLTRVILDAEFMVDDWKALETHYRELIDQGRLQWALDLRQMHHLNSMMLGLIVGFHAVLKTRGGRLKLVVVADSPISKLIVLSKLHSILLVEEA